MKPSSELLVAKFGGTSVADAAQLRKVAAIIAADPRRRVVVPSAPGKRHKQDIKITDLLYLCHDMVRKGQELGAAWDQIVERYFGIVRDLGLELDLEPVLVETRRRIAAAKPTDPPDYAASRGEAIHGRIVAALLDAEYIDACEVIRIGKGGRLDPASYGLLAARCGGGGRYVVPGFYGLGPDGQVRTFSRGGSDVTGAIVAAGLDAAVYENWTDVPGVLITDPRIVAEAQTIPEITYKELRELAYMGASVLHEDAVFPAREKGIPINIRSTNDPAHPGTRIVASRTPGPDEVVVGIAGTAGFTVFNLEKAAMNAELGFGRRVLDVFERMAISYEHTPSGIDTMSVVVADKALGDRAELVVDEIRAAVHPDEVEVSGGMALIATVGQGMNRRVGVAARLFIALAHSGVNIRMIDQGSSEQNIIVGVESADLAKAIRAIYDAFCKA